MSKIGIVILNYNDSDTTINMINQIKDYNCLNKILIVDNSSTDNSYKILKKYEKNNIEIIKTKENSGYASGNNVGIKYLEKYKLDYIIISNPDIIVDEYCIKSLAKELDKDKSISLIAPVIKQLGSKIRGWKLPNYYNDLITITNTKQRFHASYGLYKDEYYNSKLSKVDVVSGCFLMIRSDILKSINYFDENTFLYYEENILGYKLKEKGYNSYIDNELSVTHNLSVSVDKSIKKIKKYKILVKSLLYYEKYYNHINIFGYILLKIAYFISLIIAYIINIFKK